MSDHTTDRPANPFGDGQLAARQTGGAVAQTDQQRAIAEVQAAMVIARMNPRDPMVAMDRILNACTRPTLANAAVYTYSRGGSDISGPSIRLAEAMAQSWGNMQFGIRELDQRNGESTVQAFAWDVETNTRREVTFQVPHVRHTRQGSKRLEDPRDIYELVANQGARRLRACILAVIPGDVTEAAVNQCETTMHASADTSPEAMQKMLKAFGDLGVTKEQIEKRIQRRIDAIQPAQVVALKKVYASLRDGMSVPADWFEASTTSADAVRDAINKTTPGARNGGKPPKGPAIDPADDPSTGSDPPPLITRTYADVIVAMQAAHKAKNLDDLDAAASLIDAVLNIEHRAELGKKYEELRAGLL